MSPTPRAQHHQPPYMKQQSSDRPHQGNYQDFRKKDSDFKETRHRLKEMHNSGASIQSRNENRNSPPDTIIIALTVVDS